jgi:hypothetical protein
MFHHETAQIKLPHGNSANCLLTGNCAQSNRLDDALTWKPNFSKRKPNQLSFIATLAQG